jgi:hypothetical protein
MQMCALGHINVLQEKSSLKYRELVDFSLASN